MSRQQLLVVDDDADLRELTVEYLSRNGFHVHAVGSAVEMDAWLAEHHPALLILDLMLPGEDGLSIAKRFKAQGTDCPIIMLSAQGDDTDRIVGLEVGADDYITKPVNPRELLARIRAVLRRANTIVGNGERDVRSFGPFQFDLDAHQLERNGELISLTSGEFDLLAILSAHPNKVLDRDRIRGLLNGDERALFDRDRSIDIRITRLRAKIEANATKPDYIKTVWGKGYMFCPDGSR